MIPEIPDAHIIESLCPWCGHECTHASPVGHELVVPGPGDLSFCISCGQFSLFTGLTNPAERLRKPDPTETEEIVSDPANVWLAKRWRKLVRAGS